MIRTAGITILVVFTVILLCFCGLVRAQGHNLPLYDYSKRYHFGLMVGGLKRHLHYEMSDAYYRQDTLQDIQVVDHPGIRFGPLMDIHFGEFWDLRLVPALVLVTNSIHYRFFNGINEEKRIESILIDVPLSIKYKSERINNWRLYVIGGGKISYDLASDEHSIQDPINPFVPLKQVTYSWEVGAGFDFYLSFFKLSPEVRISRTFGNILVGQKDNFYVDMIRRLESSMVSVVLQFE